MANPRKPLPVTSWRNRIVGAGEENPEQLLANPDNWRIHPQTQQDALAGSLDAVGWVQQVLVNRLTGHVVDGHARVALAISRQEPSVPVLYVELEPEEERLVLATLDPISAMAGRDEQKLQALLADIAVDDAGLRALLADLIGTEPRSGLTDPDAVPAVPEDPYVKAGDLYQLGEHRLLCGDATKAEDVGRLLEGAAPQVCVTDPPYGVSYNPSWRNEALGESSRRLGKVTSDDRADWREAWVLFPGNVLYMWHAALAAVETATGISAAGFELRSEIVWVKPQLVIGRSQYHWRHEPCWYAIRRGASAAWRGGRKQTTVWEIEHILHRQAATEEDPWSVHGTQKPVECMRRPIANHPGDVYDPFVGSGTTIIAAEQLGRRCYAMDIDPRYVQVAIERWQTFTGRTAERVDG